MKTVRSACTLQEGALEIRVSDQITQLAQVIANETDGRKFFKRTHVTGGLQTLMNEGLARLSGKSSQAIFHLKQAMGGGKTHLMTGMGLLARHPGLRETVGIVRTNISGVTLQSNSARPKSSGNTGSTAPRPRTKRLGLVCSRTVSQR
jgi:hypothetical protein